MFRSFFSFLTFVSAPKADKKNIPNEPKFLQRVTAVNEAGEEIILEYESPLVLSV